MKGEWVMFRLKGRPGEKGETLDAQEGDRRIRRARRGRRAGRAMRDQRHHRPDDGRDRRRAATCGAPTAAAERRPRQEESRASPRRRSRRRSWRRWSTPCRAAPTGCSNINMTDTACCSSTAGGAATAWTRNGNDWSDKFRGDRQGRRGPARRMPDRRRGGRARQERQARLPAAAGDAQGRRSADLAFYAFDLLVDQGEDITGLPNIERKERLAALLKGVPAPILYGDHVIAKGEALFDAICKEGGEGIIAKKAKAPYRGARAKNWLKVKCIQRQEFVIVGWQASDKRRGFRSLHLARRDGRKLTYAGKVGTGFNTAMIESLSETMAPLGDRQAARSTCRARRCAGRTGSSPSWSAKSPSPNSPPTACCATRASSRCARTRRPSQVVREVPRETARQGQKKGRARHRRQLRRQDQQSRPRDLSRRRADQGRPRRLLCRRVAPLCWSTLGKRPMTLIRCPQGRAKHCFFQKHDSGLDGRRGPPCPDQGEATARSRTISTSTTPRACSHACRWGRSSSTAGAAGSTRSKSPTGWCSTSTPTSGSISPRSRRRRCGCATCSPTSGWRPFPCCRAARASTSSPRSTRRADWPAVKSFAERFSRAIAEAEPELFTANIRKNQRKGRIFLDWLRNQRGATAVMPYSARAREGAPVSAPIAWEELDGHRRARRTSRSATPTCCSSGQARNCSPAGARRSRNCPNA